VRRVEQAGCTVLVWTIDVPGSARNVETFRRSLAADKRVCTQCHSSMSGGSDDPARRPMLQNLSTLKFNPPEASWATLDRLRKLTRMKIVLKGIESREDALLAREHGADAVIVSNHGGRAAETMRGTIESLPEVADAVGAHLPVLLDGGVRRGTDVVKALALGARAVGIGRPYIWGLSAFGQPGVERVLSLLRTEFELALRQSGATTPTALTRRHVIP
jgi:isopentenyl diphosphate isomerase/L-lactate dehydrogenase-like FMN-dependent dehydrogenase